MAKPAFRSAKQPGKWEGQGSRHERGYGSDWVKLRRSILERDGHLCRACLSEGRPTEATDVDHIRPKAKGGTDNPDNLQSLCGPCHRIKTRADTRRGVSVGLDGWPTGPERHGYSIPDGLRPSAIPVVLVTGPPASGKSYYIKQHAQPGDTIIDFDECRKKVGGTKWDARKEIWRKAFALRDQLIHELHNKVGGTAYLIVTAAKDEERKAWQRVLGTVKIVVIATTEAECIKRIRSDPERAEAADSQSGAVKAWWSIN